MDFNDQVKQVIEQIRPQLQADGGDIELIEANQATGQVKVSLQGHCQHCPMASFTLEKLIEKKLKQEIKGVKEVVNIIVEK
ncbi:MAG: NifU family protein [Patescibacteria group bacterium]